MISTMKPERVLITGIDGFVGLHLARRLIDRGLAVWGTSLSSRPAAGLAPLEGVHGLRCDITIPADVESTLAVAEPDWIFHLAGVSFVPESWNEPRRTFEVNLLGVESLLTAVRRAGRPVRVLVVGSGDVYGESADGSALVEDAPCRPRSPYAVSKLAADLLARTYFERYELDVVRVRPFNHTGPGQRADFALSNFAKQIALAENGQEEPVLRVGNLDVERDITDVRDMVEAHILALEHGERGEAYNLGAGATVHLGKTLDRLIGMSRIALHLEVDPARARRAEARRILPDVGKFRRLTGWTPRIPIEKTLNDLLDHWRAVVRGGGEPPSGPLPGKAG